MLTFAKNVTISRSISGALGSFVHACAPHVADLQPPDRQKPSPGVGRLTDPTGATGSYPGGPEDDSKPSVTRNRSAVPIVLPMVVLVWRSPSMVKSTVSGAPLSPSATKLAT